MMILQDRIDVLIQLGTYMNSDDENWERAKRKAHQENNWFIPEFINLSIHNIVQNFLQLDVLQKAVQQYNLPQQQDNPKKVGLALAGNIPLVGFHDVLCVFLSGHYAIIKPSSKDETLIKHLAEKMIGMYASVAPYLQLQPMLKACDAYIATGSNNTSRYFEYYFRNYPSIIRSNRTSVAVLTGKESKEELEKLSDDIHQYFGLGCRNVTQLHVPRGYDFIPLLAAFDKYSQFSNHHKYKNNYDYQLAMHILNNRYYMTNGTTLLVEDPSPFSAISQVHYQYYDDLQHVQENLQKADRLQCRVGFGGLPFGQAQCPQFDDFADGVDTLLFLMNLSSNS